MLEIDTGWFCAYLTDIIQNLKTQVLQLLMLVWFSGSDNTLLELGRGLTSPLSSPKAILPPFLFLVKLQWVCAMIPYIKPSIYLFSFLFNFSHLLFCQGSVLFLLSSDHFLFPWLQESINRRLNSGLWLRFCTLKLSGLSWKIICIRSLFITWTDCWSS